MTNVEIDLYLDGFIKDIIKEKYNTTIPKFVEYAILNLLKELDFGTLEHTKEDIEQMLKRYID